MHRYDECRSCVATLGEGGKNNSQGWLNCARFSPVAVTGMDCVRNIVAISHCRVSISGVKPLGLTGLKPQRFGFLKIGYL